MGQYNVPNIQRGILLPMPTLIYHSLCRIEKSNHDLFCLFEKSKMLSERSDTASVLHSKGCNDEFIEGNCAVRSGGICKYEIFVVPLHAFFGFGLRKSP